MSSRIILGRGSFGFVELIDQHPQIAAKYIQRSNDPAREEILRREWTAMKKLSHPNIVQFFKLEETQEGPNSYFVIKMEYCERKSLRGVINDPTIIYNMKTVICWSEHLFNALECLETNELIHRDLKPENVVVTSNFTLKICDFGCVREMNTTGTATTAGTFRYMSPEVALGGKVSYKSDVYSIGLIIWEIVERRLILANYGINPFYPARFFPDFRDGKIEFEKPNCDPVLKEIFFCCVKFDPADRPETKDVLPVIVQLRKSFSTQDFAPIIREGEKTVVTPISTNTDSGFGQGSTFVIPSVPPFSSEENSSEEAEDSSRSSNSGEGSRVEAKERTVENRERSVTHSIPRPRDPKLISKLEEDLHALSMVGPPRPPAPTELPTNEKMQRPRKKMTSNFPSTTGVDAIAGSDAYYIPSSTSSPTYSFSNIVSTSSPTLSTDTDPVDSLVYSHAKWATSFAPTSSPNNSTYGTNSTYASARMVDSPSHTTWSQSYLSDMPVSSILPNTTGTFTAGLYTAPTTSDARRRAHRGSSPKTTWSQAYRLDPYRLDPYRSGRSEDPPSSTSINTKPVSTSAAYTSPKTSYTPTTGTYTLSFTGVKTSDVPTSVAYSSPKTSYTPTTGTYTTPSTRWESGWK